MRGRLALGCLCAADYARYFYITGLLCARGNKNFFPKLKKKVFVSNNRFFSISVGGAATKTKFPEIEIRLNNTLRTIT